MAFSFAHCEILSLLGEGAFGSVYKGRNTENGELVALKEVVLEGNEDANVADLEKEIGLLQSCKNPNIVAYLGSYLSDESLWIAMEYCGAGSCADVIEATGEPFNEDQIAYVCQEALKGLHYLHANRKIHRDIKGGNLLLNDSGEVKLADFGISAQLTQTMSKKNSFVGTPYWMAPEIVEGVPYDHRCDVWSLGITAIEFAEKVPPLNSMHPMRALFVIPLHPPPTLNAADSFSSEFNAFLASCLTKDFKRRPVPEELLKSDFILGNISGSAQKRIRNPNVIVELIDRAKLKHDEMWAKRRQEDEDGKKSNDDTINFDTIKSGDANFRDTLRSETIRSAAGKNTWEGMRYRGKNTSHAAGEGDDSGSERNSNRDSYANESGEDEPDYDWGTAKKNFDTSKSLLEEREKFIPLWAKEKERQHLEEKSLDETRKKDDQEANSSSLTSATSGLSVRDTQV